MGAGTWRELEYNVDGLVSVSRVYRTSLFRARISSGVSRSSGTVTLQLPGVVMPVSFAVPSGASQLSALCTEVQGSGFLWAELVTSSEDGEVLDLIALDGGTVQVLDKGGLDWTVSSYGADRVLISLLRVLEYDAEENPLSVQEIVFQV
jgi:hypothetical protein